MAKMSTRNAKRPVTSKITTPMKLDRETAFLETLTELRNGIFCCPSPVPTVQDVETAFQQRVYNLFDVNTDGDVSVTEAEDMLNLYLDSLSFETRAFLTRFIGNTQIRNSSDREGMLDAERVNDLLGTEIKSNPNALTFLENFRKEKKGYNATSTQMSFILSTLLQYLFFPLSLYVLPRHDPIDPITPAKNEKEIEVSEEMKNLANDRKKHQAITDAIASNWPCCKPSKHGHWRTWFFGSLVYLLMLGNVFVFMTRTYEIADMFEVLSPWILFLAISLNKAHIQNTTVSQRPMWLARRGLQGYPVFTSFVVDQKDSPIKYGKNIEHAADLLNTIESRALQEMKNAGLQSHMMNAYPIISSLIYVAIPFVNRHVGQRELLSAENRAENFIIITSTILSFFFFYVVIFEQISAVRKFKATNEINNVFRSLKNWDPPHLDLRVVDNIIAWSRINKYLQKQNALQLWRATLSCGHGLLMVIALAFGLAWHHTNVRHFTESIKVNTGPMPWMLACAIIFLSVTVALVLSYGYHINEGNMSTFRFLLSQKYKISVGIAITGTSYKDTMTERNALKGLESLSDIIVTDEGITVFGLAMTLTLLRIFWTFIFTLFAFLFGVGPLAILGTGEL